MATELSSNGIGLTQTMDGFLRFSLDLTDSNNPTSPAFTWFLVMSTTAMTEFLDFSGINSTRSLG